MRHALQSLTKETAAGAAARLLAIVLVLSLGALAIATALIQHSRPSIAISTADAVQPGRSLAEQQPRPPDIAQTVQPESESTSQAQEVNAAWYDVPPNSVTRQRARVGELTAAHGSLPIGTLMHVTHLENGRSVTVRVTDRLVSTRDIKLDLCREAAEELGTLREGIARVRTQILSQGNDTAFSESQSVATQP